MVANIYVVHLNKQQNNSQILHNICNVFTNLSEPAGYDTRSIFKQSLTSFIQFSFC